MSVTFETIKQFFSEDEWFFVEVEDRDVLMLRMNHWGENGRFSCQAEYNQDQHIFYFYSYFPINVPEEKQMKMAEFLTRANYGIRIGNFEMDYEDGEVRFRTSIDFEGQDLSYVLVSNHVYPNVWMMDRYLPGLFAVVYGDASPTEILETIEE
jgi:hypothetical protein